MKKSLAALLVLALSAVVFADDQNKEPKDTNKAEDRIRAAATVIDEIESAPDQGIPEEVLGSAECVAVVPSLLKGGFIVAANYGRGVASCRTPTGWSEEPALEQIQAGRGCLRGRRPGRAACRRRHRLEDEGPGPYLFARPRGIRRHQPLGGCDQAGQGCHPRILWTNGAVPDVVDGKGRGTTDRISVPQHPGEVGKEGGG